MRPVELISFRHLRAIAGIVRRELLGEKVLYNGVLVAVTLLFFTLLASRLSFTHPERVVLTFGLGVVRLGLVGTALLLAASVIPREYSRRTALMILSRPVSGLEFSAGIYAGIASVIALNWLVLSGVLCAVLLLFGSPPGGMLVLALSASLIEALVMTAIGMLFSVYSTPAVSVSVALGIFVAGSSFSQLRFLTARSEGLLSGLLEAASFMLPNLERFQLTRNLVHLIPVTAEYAAGAAAYAVLWIAILLLGTAALVSRRKA